LGLKDLKDKWMSTIEISLQEGSSLSNPLLIVSQTTWQSILMCLFR